MMKIAIAGTNGLAQYMAYLLQETTSHQFFFLSRESNQGLQQKGWQVLVADYTNESSLVFRLAGVDIVISTVGGRPQRVLIEAAATARVLHFVPSAFSGPEQCSPSSVANPDWQAALARLAYHESKSSMRYTIFTCGVFFERFAPGGLAASEISRNGSPNQGIGGEGTFVVDMKNNVARVPLNLPDGQEVQLCLTGARDVARFVVGALVTGLDNWPREFRFRSNRLPVSQAISLCANERGASIQTTVYSGPSLENGLSYAHAVRDLDKEKQLEQLIATAEGSLDFADATINLFEGCLSSSGGPPERFTDWLHRVWAGVE